MLQSLQTIQHTLNWLYPCQLIENYPIKILLFLMIGYLTRLTKFAIQGKGSGHKWTRSEKKIFLLILSYPFKILCNDNINNLCNMLIN